MSYKSVDSYWEGLPKAVAITCFILCAVAFGFFLGMGVARGYIARNLATGATVIQVEEKANGDNLYTIQSAQATDRTVGIRFIDLSEKKDE